MIDILGFDTSYLEIFNFVVWGAFFLILIVKFFAAIRLVPTQTAHVGRTAGEIPPDPWARGSTP